MASAAGAAPTARRCVRRSDSGRRSGCAGGMLNSSPPSKSDVFQHASCLPLTKVKLLESSCRLGTGWGRGTSSQFRARAIGEAAALLKYKFGRFHRIQPAFRDGGDAARMIYSERGPLLAACEAPVCSPTCAGCSLPPLRTAASCYFLAVFMPGGGGCLRRSPLCAEACAVVFP